MSDMLGTTPGTGWVADPAQSGAQHQAIFNSRPIYQAAGARRAPALDAQNTASDLYTATYGDAQAAIGVICAGVSDSFFGGLAAQELGAALHDWLWSRRANPPAEHEISDYLNSQQAAINDRVNTQALSGLFSRGGPADLIRRREQVGSQTSVGLYLLALDGTATFYLLGNLRAQVYPTDANAAPSVLGGDPRAVWSSLHGVMGAPVWRILRPVQGLSVAVADLPPDWGRDYRPLYQPNMFGMAASAAAATVSVAYVTAMIDPNVGPHTTAPGPAPRATAPVPLPDATRVTRPVPTEAPPPPAAPEPTFARSTMPPAASASLGDWPAPDQGRMSRHDDLEEPDMGLDDIAYADAHEDAERRARGDYESASLESGGVGLNRMGGAPPPRRPSPLDALATMSNPLRLILGGALGLLALIFLFWAVSTLLNRGATDGSPGGRATATPTGAQCFQPSNACISGRIKDVWNSDGGLEIFGLPLGPQHAETVDGNSVQVQWFQRYRMELHPENKAPYDVQLTNLGVQQYKKLGDPNVPGAQRNDPTCRWFDDVKHNVCGDFLKFWAAHGRNLGPGGNPEAASIALFGLPITEEHQEAGANGLKLTVQWFQKARLESHPANKPPFNLQMGLIGTEAGGR